MNVEPSDTVTAPERRRVPWRAPVLVGALSAGLRLVWVVAMSRVPRGFSDLTMYPSFGQAIGTGEGYRTVTGTITAYYPPGYPYFLGAVRWAIGLVGRGDDLVFAAGIVQALLGFATAAAIVVAGRRLGAAIGGDRRRSDRVGLVAGLLVACWPNLVMHASAMLSESLFLAVFAVLLALVVTMDDHGRLVTWRVVGAAAAMGLSALIRPQAVVLILPAFVAVWAVSRLGWRRTAVRTGLLCAGVVVFVAPWTVRNLVVMDGVVPVSTNTGDNLCVGFRPDATGGYALAEFCDTGENYTDGPAGELRHDAETRSRAIRWALDHPGALPLLSVDKLRITYASDHDGLYALESFGADLFLDDTVRLVLERGADVYFYLVLAGAVVGVGLVAVPGWRGRAQDQTVLLLLGATLAGVMVPVLSFADTRFKVPVAPCFALLAAVTVSWVVSHLRHEAPHPQTPQHETPEGSGDGRARPDAPVEAAAGADPAVGDV